MFTSIRSRFTIIYFLLVFIAMIIAGIFIIQSFEDYNLNIASERLDDIAQIMISELSKIEDGDLVGDKALIQASIDNHADIGLREEIFIIDAEAQQIIASSSENFNGDLSDILDDALVIDGLLGQKVEKNIQISESVRTKDKVYPIMFSGELVGLMYLRYDLLDIYTSLNKTRMIILQAILTSLVVTVIISFIISKSITDPINDITIKVSKLAEGNFDQVVEVRSDDEIGTLSKTFNFLTLELKKNIREVSREKSKLEAIINYMEDGLVAINEEGEVIHHNPKALKLLGIDEDLDQDIIGDLMSIYNSGKLNSGIGTKNVKYNKRVLKVNFAPFLDERAVKVGAVFVLQDITEEERLDNMRREFVANVSHELKTPLTSIKSYTETILDGVDDPELQRTFLEVVNTEADRMSRLVRDLLELSNFDSDAVRLKKNEYNLNQMINSCVFKVKVTADQKHQTLIKQLPEIPMIAIIDYDKIEQVVLNILSNAIKYTGDGGQIEIDLRVGESHEWFDIVVTDTGMGIPEEDLERIYERFYRVDKARSRALGGTGLGLSIAKEIIEAHHGKITITSEYGLGTKVTISLPFQETFNV
ncbi:HAMP domain-containing histidine kinase [Fusibacter sp. 3D3]|uniref:HAMP domain-containing histidine kinase n=1 Tax=Fusibacter sp. 3D3 TaxID=1048380 RepID=UPI000853E77B|nr:HAMP domain-containing histidine kinase [Fusibacter sp. 3D3]GAU76377.1 sensor histidine kinase [Fusibacter sp. 3D3]